MIVKEKGLHQDKQKQENYKLWVLPDGILWSLRYFIRSRDDIGQSDIINSAVPLFAADGAVGFWRPFLIKCKVHKKQYCEHLACIIPQI